MRGFGAVVLVIGGCYAPAIPSGAPCATSQQCPAEQTCIDGHCGGTAADATIDADAAPVTGCWGAWLDGTVEFEQPQLMIELISGVGGGTFNPTLSADNRTIYFARDSDGDLELVFATRPSPKGTFGPVRTVDGLQSQGDESKVSVGGDGDRIAVFASTRPGGAGGIDLWQAARASADDDFGAPSTALLGAVNTAAQQFDPELTPDGLHLYYAPNDTDPQHIVHASRPAIDAAFGAPATVAIPGFATTFDPTVSPDRRVLVFTAPGGQLHYATRDDAEDPFRPPQKLAFDSDDFDGDAELAPDGCSLIFISGRQGVRTLFQVAVRD